MVTSLHRSGCLPTYCCPREYWMPKAMATCLHRSQDSSPPCPLPEPTPTQLTGYISWTNMLIPSTPQGYQHIWAWCKHLLPSRVGRPCCGMWRSSPRWRVWRCEEDGVGVEDDIVVDDANVVLVVVDADLVVNVVDVNADVVDDDGDVVDGEVLPRPFPSGVNQFKHARLSPRHRDTLSAKSRWHKYLFYSHWC